MFLLDNIWLILFILWGLPLVVYRSRFRKSVYQTESWVINIKPKFGKEIKALFKNNYSEDLTFIKFRNFYRFYLIIYIILFSTSLAFSNNNQLKKQKMKIEIGSQLPLFSLPNQEGEIIDIEKLIGNKNLVIYFYPKDDSPGCTKEACYFQDQFEVFKQEDAEVIGISGQSVKSHKDFAEKYNLTFTLLSDQGNKVRKQFGVPTNFLGLIPGRVIYIIDKTGKVVYLFDSQIQATKHVDEALKILKTL